MAKRCLAQLFEVISYGQVRYVRDLLLLPQYREVINLQSDYGHYPLLIAAKQNRLDMVQCLLEAGARTNVQDFDGRTPIHFALQNANPQLIQLLNR